MTLTQLDYVLAVYKHRNFARAAEACFVTQPTLSMQLRKLEEELNTVLFDRSKQPVVPTEAAELIIDDIRQMHALSRQIKDAISVSEGELRGILRLGIIPTVAPYLLPLLLDGLHLQYPGIRLEVEELTTSALLEKLRSDELDAGIAATPLSVPGIRETPLYYEPFVVYADVNHEILKQKQVKLDELPIQDLWLLGEGHCFRNQVMNLCRKQDLQDHTSRVQLKAGSIETLQRLVEFHRGITLLPELATRGFSIERKQLIRHFKTPQPVREISLLSHRSGLNRKLTAALVETMQKVVPISYLKNDPSQVVPL